jgi:serine-type D-Ala-D-Ala carboxypeptidase/endopeptidase
MGGRRSHATVRTCWRAPAGAARVALVLLALGAATRPIGAQAQARAAARAFPPDSALLALLRQRVAQGRSAGIVVGLLAPDGTRRVVAYGDPGPGQPPLDGHSVFEIGSITKTSTGILLAQMVLDGELRLDDPVQRFLPDTARVPQRNGRPITLGHLAAHASGLPRDPSNFGHEEGKSPYATYTTRQLYDFLSTVSLPRDPGAGFEYSNVGAGLLGHALSLAAHRPLARLQEERLWRPLGLRHTGVVLTPWMRAHLALGHGVAGAITPVVTDWGTSALAGAGGVRSTADDLLTFLAANLRPDAGPLGRAMALAQRPRFTFAGQAAIGLNWFTRYTATDTIVWHNGGTAGYRTFAGFVPSRRVAVVVLTNSGGEGADDLGWHLLDPGLPLAPWPPPAQRRARLLRALTLGGALGTTLGAVILPVLLWRRRSRRPPP